MVVLRRAVNVDVDPARSPSRSGAAMLTTPGP
jgi:hypothetical protein